MDNDHNDSKYSENKEEHVDGPSRGRVNVEGVELASALYPLFPKYEDSDIGPWSGDLGLNSDGANPGTKYEDPETINPLTGDPEAEEPDMEEPPTDLDEDVPERDLLHDDRKGYA